MQDAVLAVDLTRRGIAVTGSLSVSPLSSSANLQSIPYPIIISERSMPTYGDHKAWVLVDGEEAPEFGVKVEVPEPPRAHEDPVVVSCWIPSELGKVCNIVSSIKTAISLLLEFCSSLPQWYQYCFCMSLIYRW